MRERDLGGLVGDDVVEEWMEEVDGDRETSEETWHGQQAMKNSIST